MSRLRNGPEGTLTGAIVGVGRMGLTHFAILNMLPGVRVERICDVSRQLVNTFARQLGVAAHTDPAEVIGARPDFLVVATPTATHAPLALEAIEAGIPLFVEKPLALDAGESRGVVEAVRRTEVPVIVGYVNRFNPLFGEAREIVRRGLLGDVLHVTNRMLGRTVTRPTGGGGWRNRKGSGGGVLREFGSHAIDLGMFVCPGGRIVRAAVQRSIFSSRVPDFVRADLDCPAAGFSETLIVNWSDLATRKPTNELQVTGTAGRLTVSQHELVAFLNRAGETATGRYGQGWNVRYITDLYEPVSYYLRGIEFTRQLEAFVGIVRGGQSATMCDVACDAEQAQAVDVVIEDVERVAEKA